MPSLPSPATEMPFPDDRLTVQTIRWQRVADDDALVCRAVEAIATAAAAAIARRGAFRLVLAGGNTPLPVYRALRAVPTDWNAWHIYFGDERCVAPDDPLRNSALAAAAWLDHVPIPSAQRRPIAGELGALRAAAGYADLLRGAGPFDLVLLGLGEDGHTASLFPGGDLGGAPDSPDVLAVLDAPKPPAQRVTLSAARLSRSRQVIFLVSGESKREALAAWRAGRAIPAGAVRPPGGVDVLVEAALLDAAPTAANAALPPLRHDEDER